MIDCSCAAPPLTLTCKVSALKLTLHAAPAAPRGSMCVRVLRVCEECACGTPRHILVFRIPNSCLQAIPAHASAPAPRGGHSLTAVALPVVRTAAATTAAVNPADSQKDKFPVGGSSRSINSCGSVDAVVCFGGSSREGKFYNDVWVFRQGTVDTRKPCVSLSSVANLNFNLHHHHHIGTAAAAAATAAQTRARGRRHSLSLGPPSSPRRARRTPQSRSLRGRAHAPSTARSPNGSIRSRDRSSSRGLLLPRQTRAATTVAITTATARASLRVTAAALLLLRAARSWSTEECACSSTSKRAI